MVITPAIDASTKLEAIEALLIEIDNHLRGKDFILSGNIVNYDAAGQVDGAPAEVTLAGVIERV